MSAPRRASGPIRQFSLQQQLPPVSHQVRRQRSADDGEKVRRFGKVEGERPKVRVAWVEQRRASVESEEEQQVRIVARQIPGKTRPSTGKSSKPRSVCLTEKAGILYSHQELAERLRIAWKQRDEGRSNIDIFLAHNTVEDRCESALSSSFASGPPTPANGDLGDATRREVKDEEKENDDTSQKEPSNLNGGVCEKKRKPSSLDRVESTTEIVERVEAEVSQTARVKRASFQSRLNRAFSGTIVSETPSSVQKTTRPASSAGGQRRPKVSIVIDAPSIATGDMADKAEKESAVTSCEEGTVKSVVASRPIKSAPLKRRIKSGKRRGLSIGTSREGTDARTRSRGSKTAPEAKLNDVVTMVSLISSADSDSDENADDKLIHELRNKLPTAPIIKTAVRPASTSFRKTVKSVSFHHASFDDEVLRRDECVTKEEKRQTTISQATGERDTAGAPPTVVEAAVTWKEEIISPSLPTAQPSSQEVTIDAVPEAPLTDREKRCLVVPICDLRDKKRRLLRTRSAGPRLIEMHRSSVVALKESCSQTKILNYTNSLQQVTMMQETVPMKENEHSVPSPKKVESEAGVISSEPAFQTPKEKECWHLYRRMCDKGVSVSFDTVLRGMLTPTEYRIRQKQVSQNV